MTNLGVILTEEQGQLFADLLAREAAQRGRLRLRSSPDAVPDQPWHHVVLTPDGGIPALASAFIHAGHTTGTGTYGDSPGSADCDVYEKVDNAEKDGVLLTDPKMVAMGYQITVYNSSDSDIPEDTYVLAERDPFGVWWTDGAPSGGGGGCAPDVKALNDAIISTSGCDVTVTGKLWKFNCDGTKTAQTDTVHTATIPSTVKTFLTDVTITGTCSAGTLTLTVTKTTDTVRGLNC